MKRVKRVLTVTLAIAAMVALIGINALTVTAIPLEMDGDTVSSIVDEANDAVPAPTAALLSTTTTSGAIQAQIDSGKTTISLEGVDSTGPITIGDGNTIKNITIKDSNFKRNSSYNGALFIVNKGSNLTLNSVVVDGQGGSGTTGALVEVIGEGTGGNAKIGKVNIVGTTKLRGNNFSAVLLNGGELNLNSADAEIYANTTTVNGGAVRINGIGKFTMSSGQIHNNKAVNGGAVSVEGTGTFIYNGGNIYANAATENGGAVNVINSGNLTVNGGNIGYNPTTKQADANTAKNGGAVYYYSTIDTPIIKGALITSNTALENGGGIYLKTSNSLKLDLTNLNLINNKAEANGGGVYLDSTKNAALSVASGTRIDGNTAYNGGGGIYSTSNTNVTINGGIVSGNTATDGGGIYSSGSLNLGSGSIEKNIIDPRGSGNGNGVGVFLATGGSFSMTGGSIKGNASGEISGKGGGIYASSATSVTINGGIISDNVAYDGGGIYSNGAKITVSSGSILNNTANQNGSALYINGSDQSSMTGGVIGNNNAIEDGTIYIETGKFSLYGGTISGNSASNGGAVYVNSAAILSMGNVGAAYPSITANTATAQGGAIYLAGNSNATITAGKILENLANNSTSQSAVNSKPSSGIYVDTNNLTLGGSPIISDVYLDNNRYFTQNNLSAAADSIGITIASLAYDTDQVVAKNAKGDSDRTMYLPSQFFGLKYNNGEISVYIPKPGSKIEIYPEHMTSYKSLDNSFPTPGFRINETIMKDPDGNGSFNPKVFKNMLKALDVKYYLGTIKNNVFTRTNNNPATVNKAGTYEISLSLSPNGDHDHLKDILVLDSKTRLLTVVDRINKPIGGTSYAPVVQTLPDTPVSSPTAQTDETVQFQNEAYEAVAAKDVALYADAVPTDFNSTIEDDLKRPPFNTLIRGELTYTALELHLIDSTNSNAFVSTTNKNKVTITLPYPSGTNKDNYDFKIIHYKNGASAEIINNHRETDNGLVFSITEFSPFVIVYNKTPFYTVSFDPGVGNFNDVNEEVIAKRYAPSGNTVEPPQPPTSQGLTFGGWFTGKDGSGTRFTSATPVYSDTKLFAYWLGKFTVILDTQGGDYLANLSVIQGEKLVDLPTPTRPGFTFKGWYTAPNGAGNAVTASTTVNTNPTTLYANWEAKGGGSGGSTNFTITFNSDGGSSVASISNITPGATIPLPADPTKLNNTFGGWFTAINGGGTQFTATTKVYDNITLFAKWIPASGFANVTFDTQGATTANFTLTTAIGSTVTPFPASPIKTGFTFSGWYTAINGGGVQFTSATKVAGPITVYAKWTSGSGGGGGTSSDGTYTVTFDTGGGTAIASQKVYPSGLAYNPGTPAKSNYKFTGWYSQKASNGYGTGTLYDFNTPITKDTTIYAGWQWLLPGEPPKYTVKFYPLGGSAVADIVDIADGSTVTLPSPTKKDYRFVGWYTKPNGQGTLYYSGMPITSSIALYANWSWTGVGDEPLYTVKFDSLGGSKVADVTKVQKDGFISLPTPTKDKYTFDGWYKQKGTDGLASGEQFTAATPITEDTTLYAKWKWKDGEEPRYTVTFDSRGGSAVGNIVNVVPSAVVGTLPTPIRTNYRFDGWFTQTNGGGTQFTAETPVTDNITLYAKWTNADGSNDPNDPNNPDDPNIPDTPVDPALPDDPTNPDDPNYDDPIYEDPDYDNPDYVDSEIVSGKTDAPKTGDKTPIGLYVTLIVVGIAGLILISRIKSTNNKR